MISKTKLFLCLALLIILITGSFLTVSKWLDPDFGWHLQTGNLILQRGVPMQDWYSFTMPTFQWIDHEWLVDVFIAKGYQYLGFPLLLTTFLLLYALSFFVVVDRQLTFIDILFPIVLGYFSSMSFLGIRPQLITVFFTAILLWLVNRFLQRDSKLSYVLPLLFLVWVNIHAGFFFGLALLGVVWCLEVVKKIPGLGFLRYFNLQVQSRKKILILTAIITLCFVATLVNPYGLRVYQEVFRTIFDNFLKQHIQEWLPLYSINFFEPFNFLMVMYISLFVALMLCFQFFRKIPFNMLVLSLLGLCMAISSKRNYLIFLIISIPVFCKMVYYLRTEYFAKITISDKIKRLLFDQVKWQALLLGITAASVALFVVHFVQFDFKNNVSSYPVQAVAFIKTLPLSGNLFNEYGWGGYLIWQIPERKEFIDGRMPSWRQDGQFAFGDYIKVNDMEAGFPAVLDKYHITYMLVESQSAGSNTGVDASKISSTSFRKFLFAHPPVAKYLGYFLPQTTLYNTMISMGWKTIYKDNVAAVLQRP